MSSGNIKAGEAYVSISGDNSGLKTSISDASGSLKRFAADVERLEKEIVFEPEFKQEKLEKQIAAAKKKIELLALAQKKALSAEDKGSYFSQLIKAYDDIFKKMQTLPKAADVASASIKAMGQAFVAAGQYASDAVKEFAAFGDKYDKMAGRTGMSTSFLSGMDFVANINGANIEKVEAAIKGMQTVLSGSDGDKKLKEIGLSLDAISGMDAEGQFLAITDAIGKLPTPTERAGAAMKLFSEAGRDLLPMINAGGKSMSEYMDIAKKLGVVIDEVGAGKAAKLTDSITMMENAFKGLKIGIGGLFADEAAAGADYIVECLIRVKELVEQNKDVILEWVDFFRQVGETIVDSVVKPLAELAGFDFSEMTGGLKKSTDELNNQQAAMAEKLRLLEELSQKESLSSQELDHAKGLLSEINGAYGEIGALIDTNTGKIKVQHEAWAKMAAAMKAEKIATLKEEIAKDEERVAANKKKFDKATDIRKGKSLGETAGQVLKGTLLFDTRNYDPRYWASIDKKAEWQNEARKEWHQSMSALDAKKEFLKLLESTPGYDVPTSPTTKEETRANDASKKVIEAQEAIDNAKFVGRDDKEIKELEKQLKAAQKQQTQAEYDLAAKQRSAAVIKEKVAAGGSDDKAKAETTKAREEADKRLKKAEENRVKFAGAPDTKSDSELTEGEKRIADLTKQITAKTAEAAKAKFDGKDSTKLDKELDDLATSKAAAEYEEAIRKAAKAAEDEAKATGEGKEKARKAREEADKAVVTASNTLEQIATKRKQAADEIIKKEKEAAKKAEDDKKKAADEAKKKEESKKKADQSYGDKWDKKKADLNVKIADAKMKGDFGKAKKYEDELEDTELKAAIDRYKKALDDRKKAMEELSAAEKRKDDEAIAAANADINKANSEITSNAKTAQSIYDRQDKEAYDQQKAAADAAKKWRESVQKQMEEAQSNISVKVGSKGTFNAFELGEVRPNPHQQKVETYFRKVCDYARRIQENTKSGQTATYAEG